MTSGQFGGNVLVGACMGGLGAGGFHSIYRLITGKNEHWIFPAVFIVVGIVVWVAFKIAQERLLAKEYEKIREERERRMK